ncbi:MAG TPA: hypothetical protein VFU49_14665 [Ktedonobacteraceae bacterium]|nr:hypothetical protein [Ktedonobacteraceae bacterium]
MDPGGMLHRRLHSRKRGIDRLHGSRGPPLSFARFLLVLQHRLHQPMQGERSRLGITLDQGGGP